MRKNIVNPKLCNICNHPDRAEIEMAVLSISPSNPKLTLEAIADAFGVSCDELRVHSLMHSPLALDFSEDSAECVVRCFQEKAGSTSGQSVDASAVPYNAESIVEKVGMREGDVLQATVNEYLTTLKTLGRRIKYYASDRSDEYAFSNFCSKAVVDLYLGCGAEIRQSIKEISALNSALNGDQNSGSEGLKALAQALTLSSGKDK